MEGPAVRREAAVLAPGTAALEAALREGREQAVPDRRIVVRSARGPCFPGGIDIAFDPPGERPAGNRREQRGKPREERDVAVAEGRRHAFLLLDRVANARGEVELVGDRQRRQIGRASCRERVCQYV